MHRTLIILGMVLCCGRPGPADVPMSDSASRPPTSHVEAQAYTRQLLSDVIIPITEEYIRPISRSDLANAALSGLYEAVREPVPPSLAEEVQQASTDEKLFDLVQRIRTQLGETEELRGGNALLASIRAITRILDPYSGLVRGEELLSSQLDNQQQGFGLNLVGNAGAGPLIVKAVHPGGPAQKAGIRPGDQITAIDGRNTKGITSAEAQERLGGNALAQARDIVAPAELTVMPAGSRKSHKVKLEPAIFRPETILGTNRRSDNSWDYWLDKNKKIAHVRVAALSTGTSEELQQILTGLKAQGLRGLILDLRWCPGGFLHEAEEVARLFIHRGTIASVAYRDRRQNEEFRIFDEHPAIDIPIVALVNGESSGGAELIAAALQDNKRAAIAGQRTRGKGSVQKSRALPIPGAGMKLTTGMFIRPGGKNLHRFPDSKPTDDWGVRPDADLELRVSADLSRQLREWWLLQTLRPGTSNEAMPLDDPLADPQQHAAMQALERKLK